MTKENVRRYIGAVGGSPDAWIDAAIDFAQDQPELRGIFWNRGAPEGLRLYIGKRAATWQYFSQRRDHGSRAHTFKTLGRYNRGHYFPGIPASGRGQHDAPPIHRAEWHMDYRAACNKATVERAGVIQGTPSVNPGAGPTFAQAFDGGYEIIEGRKPVKIEGYLQYLERQAQEAGKPPRWADKVGSLGRVYMVPKWGKYRLIEMSDAPNAVAEWCAGIKSATSANHISRIMRAMWRRVAKRDPNLQFDNYPTRAFEKRKERGEQKGMIVRDFAAWYETVKALPPVRHAYHLCNLLTGARPGELARTPWANVADDALTIGNAKTGNAIPIVLTPEICACLKMATDAVPDHKPDDLIFPGCESNLDRDKLPVRGHALRRTYRTFAHSLKVPDDIGNWLLGQAPEGVKAHYLLKWSMANNAAIVAAQHKISRAMMAALKAKPAVAKRKRAA